MQGKHYGFFAVILLVSACSGTGNNAGVVSAAVDSSKVTPVVGAAEAAPTPPTDWQAEPSAVLEAVFEAARTKNYSKLSGLCDPKGEGDGDTRRYVCSIPFSPEAAKTEFINYFQYAQIIGKPVIVADTAMVQIKFGPQGARDESVQLIRRDAKWYLYSF